MTVRSYTRKPGNEYTFRLTDGTTRVVLASSYSAAIAACRRSQMQVVA
ncbi:hypothetical protein [Stenotrophomonas maltophilia]|nr:hypothetical protein [Stenotrophomonas maltophilia]MCO5735903.1 hypothetical protein [Stenotrophomonas maltophilia]